MRSLILAACSLACACSAAAQIPPTPNFYARRDYTGVSGYWHQVADTNRDGIPDLILNSQGYIQVLLGNGDGTFRAGPDSHTSGNFSYAFVVSDLNGDGIPDLIETGQLVGAPPPGGIVVCFGKGDGTFTSGVSYQIPNGGAEGLVLGDFNNDGIPDVAVDNGVGIWLFTGKGGGSFNPAVLAVTLSFEGSNVASARFRAGGNLDLVLTNNGGSPVVLLGNGDGTFGTPMTLTGLTSSSAVATGALTKNGYASIAVVGTGADGTGAYLYYGNGAGAFSAATYVDLPGGSSRLGLAIADISGDGIPDLISCGGYVAYGRQSGGFAKPVSYPVVSGGGNIGVVVAQLRRKAGPDVVTVARSGAPVLLNQGRGVFEDGAWTNVSGGAGCGAVADFNRDGKPDLAVNTLTAPTGVNILLGTGNAKKPYSKGASIPLAGAGCLVTGDINNDGIPDLIVPANLTAVAYLGKGDGTFTLASTTSTPSGGFVALGDFNHDGKLDFVTSGNLLALGNGDGTFLTPVPFVPNPPSSPFFSLTVGDINNDGWPDVVLISQAYPYVDAYVLLNDQQGGFTELRCDCGHLGLQAILVDLNRDGFQDLVTTSVLGGSGIYLGDGTGQFTPAPQSSLYDPLDVAAIAVVADLNADGIPDIGLLEGDTLAVFLGTGGANYADPFCIGTGPAPGSIYATNLHGQSPSAGLADIVIPDQTGGVMALIT